MEDINLYLLPLPPSLLPSPLSPPPPPPRRRLLLCSFLVWRARGKSGSKAHPVVVCGGKEGRNEGLSLSPSSLAGEENLGAGPALKNERVDGFSAHIRLTNIQDV